MKTVRLLLSMLLACALLAACGNKGDLVRPQPKAATVGTVGAVAG
jgi:predicted small lipoprotein YifL